MLPPDIPRRRLNRDLAAMTAMGVGLAGIVGTLFLIAPLAGVLAVFVTIGALGVVLGIDNDG